MKPDRVVIGTDDERARDVLRHLYAPFVRTNDRILVMDARSAELTKYAANAFLATRISFMNDIANLCEKRRRRRRDGAPRHGHGPAHRAEVPLPRPRLRRLVLPEGRQGADGDGARARPAARDPRGGAPRQRAAEARCSPTRSSQHFGGGSLAGKTVALWGLAFKPGTDDIREAPALSIIERLLAAGAVVHGARSGGQRGHRASSSATASSYFEHNYDAAEGADALALVTEWHEFRRPNFQRLKELMADARALRRAQHVGAGTRCARSASPTTASAAGNGVRVVVLAAVAALASVAHAGGGVQIVKGADAVDVTTGDARCRSSRRRRSTSCTRRRRTGTARLGPGRATVAGARRDASPSARRPR